MRTIALVFIVLLLAGCSKHSESPPASDSAKQAPQKTNFPIRWTKHLNLRSMEELKNLDTLLDSPVITPNGQEKICMINDKEHKVTVTLPRQWLALRKKGYVPLTNYDIKAEGWFKEICRPRMLLKKAVPARKSYLRDFRLTSEPLKHLPPQLGLILSGDEERRVARLSAQGKTWDQIWAGSTIRTQDNYSIVIRDEGQESSICLLAWADFNRDGLEDVLLQVTNHARGGTLGIYRYVTLTRKQPAGRLLILADRQ